ncbi:hypothetical protein [Agromyces sp. LHK192]|uniref:hypothetical protein n=1 Tax=Agromyces sp. LHK192 TaxID=2498704 RepID=UPI000FD840B2|nr:hypothetical protein [Agromyces sp. LHK192]
MTRPSAVAVAVAIGTVALSVLTGCTGDTPEPPPTPTAVDLEHLPDDLADYGNGLWLLTGAEAADEVVAAVRAAGAVRYSGRFTELTEPAPDVEPVTGRSLGVDFAGTPSGYTATLFTDELRAEIIAVDGLTYLRGNDAYAARAGLPELAAGYVCTTGDDDLVDEWAPLLRPADLVGSLLGASDSIAVGEPRGDDATLEIVVGAGEAPAGILRVQRSGPPLPATFTAGDASGDGTFTFESWGQPFDVAAPTDVVRDCA